MASSSALASFFSNMTVTQLILLLVGINVVLRVLEYWYRILYGPLKDIPGPRLRMLVPVVFDLPMVLAGRVHKASFEAHQKFGPVFRTGVDRVSVADPEAAQMILKSVDFPKSPMYALLKDRNDPDNLFMTNDKTFHRTLRRLISPAFSIQFIGTLEKYMLEMVGRLFSKIEASNATGGDKFDLGNGFQNLAMDVIGETAFGKGFDMIEKGTHPLHESRRILFAFTPVRRLFYIFFGWIPYLHLDERLFKMLPVVKHAEFSRKFTDDVVQARKDLIAREGSSAEKKFTRHDILQTLLTHQDEQYADRLTDQQVATEAGIFLTAGSETTANTLTWTVLLLLRNPGTLQKLTAELDAAFPNVQLTPAILGNPSTYTALPHDTLKRLPYLDAVLKESMRLLPVAATGLPRQTDRDISIASYNIPAGTTVFVAINTLHNSPRLWKKADEYLPERWFREEEEEKGEGPKWVNKNAYLPFSAGTRNCIGMTFAWQEMRTVLAHVIRYYDLELCEGQEKIVDEAVSYITLSPKGGHLFVRARRRV